jgi:hypothetical protein
MSEPWPIRARAALGFHPVGSQWGVNAASASGATDGLAGFCDQVAELQRAMGASDGSIQNRRSAGRGALRERRAATCAASERTCALAYPRPQRPDIEWSLVNRVIRVLHRCVPRVVRTRGRAADSCFCWFAWRLHLVCDALDVARNRPLRARMWRVRRPATACTID